MEIETKIVELFKAKDVAPPTRDYSNSEMEMKKIEQQLNLHMKNKQGLKYKKISIVHDKFYNEDKFSEVIDEELKTKMHNKKWKALPMCMKWSCLQEYFKEHDITNEAFIADVRSKLSRNILQVDYQDKKIIKLGGTENLLIT